MSFNQLKLGRGEPILDPDIPIIDAHHHLFVRPTLHYMFDDFLADVRAGHNIVASVYVETRAMMRQEGPEMMRPIGEIEFANGVGAMAASGVFGARRVCAAIVGHADLRLGEAIAEYLDRALERAPDRLRSIRQVVLDDPGEAASRFLPPGMPLGVMKHPNFKLGFRQLARRGLCFEAAAFHHQLQEVAELAAEFPDTTIVINHAGHAIGWGKDAEGRAQVFREWRSALLRLAEHSNIVCKVGGFGLPLWGFGFEERSDPVGYLELASAWKPYIETVIETFGARRCMMESNYPIDGRSCGYVPLWNALKHVVRSASGDEKAALFSQTAAKTYRIGGHASS